MSAFTTRDFASLLDDAIAAADADREPVVRPGIPFDFLQAQGESIAGRAETDAAAAAEYLFAAIGDFSVAPDLSVLMAILPSTDPEEVSAELGLKGHETPPELDRIRRDFAFANHPDRVAADLRDRALQRMQIVNMMIDDAKRRFAKFAANR
ncbi:MAG: hypothetical protein Q8Q62_01655 [Mesorhizobium sp.]|nr:hypothetical protein [Mesorhizobium sp.]